MNNYIFNPHALPVLITGLAMLVSGVFVLGKNPASSVNRMFSLICLCVAVWLIPTALGYFSREASLARFWFKWDNFGVAYISVTVFHFINVFLNRSPSRFIPIGYAVASLFGIIAVATDWLIQGVARYPWGYFPQWGLFFGALLLAFFFSYMASSFYLLLAEYRTVHQAVRRNQIKYLFLAFLLAYTGSIDYLPAFGVEVYPLGFISIFSFLSVIALTVVRYRLMDITVAMARGTIFALVYIPILGVPLLGALAMEQRLQLFFGRRWWIWLWIACAALAVFAHYVNRFFQRRAEARLLAEQRRYQAVLRQAAQGMTLIRELDRLLQLIVHLLTRAVRVRHAAVYLWDEKRRAYARAASRLWPVKEPPVFAKDSLLGLYMLLHRTPIVTGELLLQSRHSREEQMQSVVRSLKDLAAAVVIPSFVEDRCLGFLALGEKSSGGLYTEDDLQVFQVLSSQAALAIENARFYEELQQTQANLFQTAKMASLGHMAGGMSHQVNNRFHVLTLLAGVTKSLLKDAGVSGFLKMEPQKQEAVWAKLLDTMDRVEKNSMRGGEIAKTLLKYAKPARGYRPISIRRVVDLAREVAVFQENAKEAEMDIEIPDGLRVNGNLNQLSDSCQNLFGNAFDAIEKKTRELTENKLNPLPQDAKGYRGRFKVRARKEEQEGKNWVVMEFSDNGIGMTEKELEYLFIPFYTSKATADKGTGLGLYVIQQIIRQHGGTITPTSTYGVGTTFTIRLPAYEGKVEEDAEAADRG